MIRPVVFLTATSRQREHFLWALHRVGDGLPLVPKSVQDIQALGSDSKSPEEELMAHLHDGKEVVVDANALHLTLDRLPPLSHEYLARLHMVVDNSPESDPVIVDYFIGRALDLLDQRPTVN